MFENLFKETRAKEQPEKKGMFEGLFDVPVTPPKPQPKQLGEVFDFYPDWQPTDPTMKRMKELGFGPPTQQTPILETAKEELGRIQEKLTTVKKEFKTMPGIISPGRGVWQAPFMQDILGKKTMDKTDKINEIRNLEIATEFYQEFITKIEDEKDPNALNRMKYGAKKILRTPEKLVPFYQYVQSAEDFNKLIAVGEKLKKGQELTDAEQSYVDRYQAEGLPIPYDRAEAIGMGIMAMPTWIAEWATLQSVIGKPIAKIATEALGKTLVKKIVVEVPTKIAKVYAPELVKKGAVKIGLDAIIGNTIGLAVRGASNIPAIASTTLEKYIPNYSDVLQSPVSKMIYGELEKQEVSWEKAMAQAFGEVFVENITESAGVLVDSPIRFLATATLGRWAFLRGIKEFTKPVVSQLAKLGWNGIIGEVFEEELAEFFQAPIAGREYKHLLTPEGKERFFTSLGVIGIFGGIGGVSVGTIASIQNWRNKTNAPVIEAEPEAIIPPKAKIKPEVITLPETKIKPPPKVEKEVVVRVSAEEKKELLTSIGKKEEQLREFYKTLAPEKVEQALGEVWLELEMAEAGARIPIVSPEKGPREVIGMLGKTSSFPTDIPEHLRSKKLFNKVMEGLTNIENIKFPAKNFSRQRELYDRLLEKVDSKVGLNTSKLRQQIINNYDKIYKPETAVETGVDRRIRGEIPSGEIDVSKIFAEAAKEETITPEGVGIEKEKVVKITKKAPPKFADAEAKKYKSAEEFVENSIKTTKNNVPLVSYGYFKSYPLAQNKIRLFDISEVETISAGVNREAIIKEIKEDGLIPPIVDIATGEVIDGNHRVAVLQELGYKKIPVIDEADAWVQDPDTYGQYPWNVPEGESDKPKISKLAKELEDYNSADQQLTDIYIQATAKAPPEAVKAPLEPLKPAEPIEAPKDEFEAYLEKEFAKTNLFKQIERRWATIEEKGQPLYAKKWEVKMAQKPEVTERINKTQIMTWAEKTFGVPLKGKATHKWKSAGVYYPKAQIVRMQKWGELSVLAHEVSHHIDRVFRKTLGRNWYRPNKVIVKELADLDYDQKKRRTEEGFAEYIRYRMTTELAKEKAPEFHKYFNQFLNNNQETKTKLEGLKEKMDIWHKQGAENRIIQHIDWKKEHTEIKGIMPKLKNALRFINEKFNDEFYIPQTIVREIEKVIGKKLTPTKNPAIMMEYYKSKAGAVARTFVMDKAIDEYGNMVGPGLVEVLKPISNNEIKQFVAYAVSKRALNLAERNIESGFDVDDAKFIIEKYKDKGWDETAKNLTNWSNHLLGWVIRAGGLDKKTAKLMRDLNPTYLPFKRAFIDEVGVISGVGGYVDTGGAIKGIKGSGRPIINPIEAMIAQTRELIAKSQKIRIANLFAEIAEEKGVGGFITKVPAPMRATKFSASQIEGYVEQVTGERWAIRDANDFLTVFTQDFRYGGKENIVSLWRNGKQKFYEIHPDLYETFKGIDPLKLGPVGKIFAPFARMLRLGATGLKLSFGLARNPFRDALSYAVFSKRRKVTVFDPIKGVYKDITTKPGEITWRFKKLGGALSGQIGLDRAATQNTYDEMLMEKLGKKGKVLKIVKHPISALRDIISITEMGPRSAEVEAAYKKYTSGKWQRKHPDWTEEDAFVQAFNDAQDVTINFTKSGKWAKQINDITAFFNVAIRGPEKVYSSFRERPIQTFVKGLSWLTLLAIGSWYKNKDEDWYKNLPPAYKYNNLFFKIGNNVFRLPIPFEIGMIFMSAPQAMLDSYKDKDDKWIKNLIDLAKSQIPDPTPSMLRPAIDVATNRNWMGIPIESAGMQYLYPTERKKDYTSKFAIGMSKGMNKVGVKLSPIQLDYLIDSYSGGFLRQFRISGGEMYDLPVLSDLMLKDPDYPRRQLNEYFADYEVLKQKKQADIATKDELRKLNKIDGFYKYYKDMQKRIKDAEKKKDNKRLKGYYDRMIMKLKIYGYD